MGSTGSRGCAASGVVLGLLWAAAASLGKHRCTHARTALRREHASATRVPTHSAAPMVALRPKIMASGAIGVATTNQ